MVNRPEFVALIPEEAGAVKGIMEYKGVMFVACAFGVYVLKEEIEWKQETRIVKKRWLEPMAVR